MLARAAAAAAAAALACAGRRTATAAPPQAFARWLATTGGDDGDAATPSTSSSADASAAKAGGKGPRGRRPSRRVAGSWAVSQELQEDLDAAREVPAGAHLYDLQNTFPYFYQARGVEDVAAAVKAAMADAGKTGEAASDTADAPPHPDARPIVCWETRAVLHAGPAGADHPANRKVVASVRLADLAAEAGLSADAARHVALVAGPRYNPHTGVLRLTAEAAPAREGNVAIVERLLRELVAEGKRVHPAA